MIQVVFEHFIFSLGGFGDTIAYTTVTLVFPSKYNDVTSVPSILALSSGNLCSHQLLQSWLQMRSSCLQDANQAFRKTQFCNFHSLALGYLVSSLRSGSTLLFKFALYQVFVLIELRGGTGELLHHLHPHHHDFGLLPRQWLIHQRRDMLSGFVGPLWGGLLFDVLDYTGIFAVQSSATLFISLNLCYFRKHESTHPLQ